ncbi:hypothetical protein [Coleofasciculus sp. H7-2]|uniref:hypothetical protein n=1 Tax=Coleofasciculus sp. H7-2 TaxID=3351545 RepID=UPI00367099E6
MAGVNDERGVSLPTKLWIYSIISAIAHRWLAENMVSCDSEALTCQFAHSPSIPPNFTSNACYASRKLVQLVDAIARCADLSVRV